METKSLRSPVSNFSYSYYSALQDRTFLSEGGDATVGFDYNLTPNQKRTFKNLTNAEYNKSELVTHHYLADSYEDAVMMISNDIDNYQYELPNVFNPDCPELPVTVEAEYVQIVNERKELEYIDEDKLYV